MMLMARLSKDTRKELVGLLQSLVPVTNKVLTQTLYSCSLWL